jgi:hypothetical protein
MSDFLSINPVPDTVMIGDKKVDVYGISMEGLGHLLPRFPDLIQRMEERRQKDGGLSLPAIIEVCGSAIGPVLAAGFGLPGNEEAERKATLLSAAEQLNALTKIVDKTMPDGPVPFVEQWATLMQKFATPEPRKMRFKILQTESNSSPGVADTLSKQSGA